MTYVGIDKTERKSASSSSTAVKDWISMGVKFYEMVRIAQNSTAGT